ncbi:MAG: hypothetical protein M0002_15990 [Rhodospirillales bacterium]|nr:hypothetical protein [Rhodospirillales bacterium]
MTPFGAHVRSLRLARGIRLIDLAAGLQVTPAYFDKVTSGVWWQPEGEGRQAGWGTNALLAWEAGVESMGIHRIERDVEGEVTRALRGVTAFADDG